MRVTILAPMKRGLKGALAKAWDTAILSYNPCPDEKGTERWYQGGITGTAGYSYNPCPDEKGTESSKDGGTGWDPECYNPCPDEKGTESLCLRLYLIRIPLVTILAPMKRGLKARKATRTPKHQFDVTILAPMKRGLKEY